MKLLVIRNACGDPYLIRHTLCTLFGFSLKVHTILRSDEDRALHDHPWTFATWMWKGGYWEERFTGGKDAEGNPLTKKTWIGPGTLRLCRAPYAHRLELPIEGEPVFNDKGVLQPPAHYRPAVTLVLTWPQSRDWGFYMPGLWVDQKDYLAGKEC